MKRRRPGPRLPPRWLTPLLVVPLAALLAFGLGRDPNLRASPLLGHPAPEFHAVALDGHTVDLAAMRGHAVVINFWASWCVACRTEHPALLAAYNAWRPQGVNMVGVLFEDQPSAARAFMIRMGGDWPIVQDGGSSIAISYGVTGVPETFVVDRRGVIVMRMVGPVDSASLDAALSQAVP